jgi:hypothetical protein
MQMPLLRRAVALRLLEKSSGPIRVMLLIAIAILNGVRNLCALSAWQIRTNRRRDRLRLVKRGSCLLTSPPIESSNQASYEKCAHHLPPSWRRHVWRIAPRSASRNRLNALP